MKKYFFTSDYHFGHNNIIRYDDRPFKDVHHMAETIIENHNSVVSNEDEYYFLGDFCFNRKYTEGYLERMNGKKFFIKGNHDKSRDILMFEKYGTYLGEQCMLHTPEHNIDVVLNHFAMRVWDKHHHGSIHLYGHSHMSLEKYPNGKSMDVCIIGNNYFPYEIKDIIKIMSKREIHKIDHHEKEL